MRKSSRWTLPAAACQLMLILLLALAAAAETAAPGVTDDYGRGCRHCGVERTRQERTAPVKAACHAAVAEVEPLFCDSKAVAPLTAIDLDEHAQPPCPAAAAMVYPDKGCTGNSCCSVAVCSLVIIPLATLLTRCTGASICCFRHCGQSS